MNNIPESEEYYQVCITPNEIALGSGDSNIIKYRSEEEARAASSEKATVRRCAFFSKRGVL